MKSDYGLFVWPSAIVLAEYIFHNSLLFSGKHIIELGCGTCLPGLVACYLDCKVTFTDMAYPEDTSKMIEMNCNAIFQMNKHLFYESSLPLFVPFNWGQFNSKILSISPKPDIIIGSDVLYDEKDFDDLFASISFFMDLNPSVIFITSYQERSDSYYSTLLFLLNKWRLNMTEVALSDFFQEDRIEELQGKTIALFVITRKVT